MDKQYRIDLDEFAYDIFYEMERISEGLSGHECIVNAPNKDEAVEKLLNKLTPFLKNLLES